MSRSERWSSQPEIRRHFVESTDQRSGAGPVLYVHNGKKYIDDSEAHIAAFGRTGKGKSQCASLPYSREIAAKGESLIMLDPKGEGYYKTACYFEKTHRVYCVNLRNPRKSPTKWSPLGTPYRLFQSDNADDRDIASSMLSEFWNGVYPYDGNADRFWTDASVNYAKGLTYGLFEKAAPKQVNLNSVAVMMEQSEIRSGAGTVLKEFYESLPSDSLAKRNLATYATAPNETRASIHSVAAAGIEVFSRSQGLMEMLSEDTLNILDIDVSKPFALFIITPDETDVYDSLAGLLISQLTQHLIRVAQERGGRLPIRVNVILEELGSVGRSIPTLPNLMVAGRSRNIRLMLVLQSITQLVDVYGKSKAETINSCIGTIIGFSTNNWETLSEWSQRCGEKITQLNGRIIKEPLITAAQLAAMPTGTAIVMADNQYKFISRLPFYHELYHDTDWHPPIQKDDVAEPIVMGVLDFENMVKENKQKKIGKTISSARRPGRRTPNPFHAFSDEDEMDIDELMAQIDTKIAEMEKEEAEKKQKEAKETFCVLVMSTEGCEEKIAHLLEEVLKCSAKDAKEKISQSPFEVKITGRQEAMALAKAITEAGGIASIRTGGN